MVDFCLEFYFSRRFSIKQNHKQWTQHIFILGIHPEISLSVRDNNISWEKLLLLLFLVFPLSRGLKFTKAGKGQFHNGRQRHKGEIKFWKVIAYHAFNFPWDATVWDKLIHRIH